MDPEEFITDALPVTDQSFKAMITQYASVGDTRFINVVGAELNDLHYNCFIVSNPFKSELLDEKVNIFRYAITAFLLSHYVSHSKMVQSDWLVY
ncbi:hypothetical protein ACU60T_25160 [Klebsiella aerogenes]